MATGVDRTDAVTVESELRGVRAVPVRIALGVLSVGTPLWVGLVVVVPVALLVGIFLLPVPPVIGVQIALFFVFMFWASAAGYDRKRTTVDPAAGTVSIERPSGVSGRKTDVHDLDAVDAVAIQRLGSVALVTIRSDASLLTASRFVAPASELPTLTDALRATGVPVTDPDFGLADDGADEKDPTDAGSAGAAYTPGPHTRLVATALLLLGVPIVILLAFGAGPVALGTAWVVIGGGIAVIGGGLLRFVGER